MSDTVFGKIIAGDIPADKLYEDEHCIVIRDIQPQAAVHVLIIPKKPLENLSDASGEDQSLLGHLLLVVKRMAEKLSLAEGYRVIINNGAGGGQTVYHLHIHLVGGAVLREDRL